MGRGRAGPAVGVGAINATPGSGVGKGVGMGLGVASATPGMGVEEGFGVALAPTGPGVPLMTMPLCGGGVPLSVMPGRVGPVYGSGGFGATSAMPTTTPLWIE